MKRTTIIAALIWSLCSALLPGADHQEAAQLQTASIEKKSESYSEDERNHWSILPVVRPSVPKVSDEFDRGWVRQPIDAFILQELRANNLRPAPPANRETLIRRLSFDLTGLPPSPEEIRQFKNDQSAKAYEKLIDRLLSSPHYGERWGQHWLDVVRYSETEGFEYDRYRPNAWRFRDYVIRSFNDDKPYNQFVREQLAGDELAESLDGSDKRDAQLAAGLHRLGPVRRNAGNAEVAFSRNEVLTEMTNIIGSAFLGLTVGCAECHDHFYDAIRQKDYYRFKAFLASTHEADLPLSTATQRELRQQQVDRVQAEIDKIKQQLKTADVPTELRLREKLFATEARMPKPLPAIFTVENDEDQRAVVHLLERGDETKPLEQVGMRVLGVLLPDEAPELPAETSHPKTILADWITSPENPLTARVMVNRIWQYHFSQGLVATANDFGVNGSPPSHPELLDYLAADFVASGWSIKEIHRTILLSNTYQQASRSDQSEAVAQIDPDNRLLWRFNRRRLDAEEIRDSMLAIAGILNRKAGGESVVLPVDPKLVELLYKPTQWQVTADTREHKRRSVYLLAKRNLKLPFMEVFDQPDLQTSCANRIRSTHAPQALAMLNGPLSNKLAKEFARRLQREAGNTPAKQIELAFRLTVGRAPTAVQAALAGEFLQEQPLQEFALAMFNLNSFLYVE